MTPNSCFVGISADEIIPRLGASDTERCVYWRSGTGSESAKAADLLFIAAPSVARAHGRRFQPTESWGIAN
jgi:hypothetical protein